MIEILLLLVAILILLLLKGFFSGSEIALVHCDKVKLTARANQGHQGAKSVLQLFRTPDVLLGTTLVGTNIATVALTTVGTLAMLRLFGPQGDLYAFLILTPVLLILGEIVPKSIFQQKSDLIAPVAIYPLRWFSFLFYPVVFVFSRIARFVARLVGAGRIEQNLFNTREQIRAVVDMAERTSSVDAFDRGRIKRVIRFGETTVAEAMIPIAEISAINVNRSMKRAIAMVRKRGYNRLPVYTRNTSNIIGVVTLTTWDLLEPDLEEKSLEQLMKPAKYISPYQTIDQLLPVLRNRKDHMAIVVDEFGSAVGIITMEDILEEVVGEIDVGYNFEEYLPRRPRTMEEITEGVYLLDSRLAISEVNEFLQLDLPTTDFHTIGGLLMARLRHIPKKGEEVIESGFRFTVEEATDRNIVKIRVEEA